MADPATNAARIAEQVQALHDDGVDVALFPDACSGYAIDDLLLQDVLLDAVDAAVVDLAKATPSLRPVVVVEPRSSGPASTTAPSSCTAARSSASCPRSTCPTTASSTRSAGSPADDARGTMLTRALARRRRGPGTSLRPGPHLPRQRPARPDDPRRGLRGHVGADPPSARAAPRRRPRPAQPLGLPITVARAEDRHLLARSASSRCNAAYLYAAASAGSPPPTSPGTA